MLKRCLSAFLGSAMMFSLIPIAMADGTGVNIKSFNATKSAIIINFNSASEAMTAADGEIKVYKTSTEGATLLDSPDFNVIATDTQSGTDATGNALTTADANTVILEPVDGIDTNAIYKVDIAGATTGYFQVNQIFFDDFNAEGKYTATDADYPYYWYNNQLYSKWWTSGQNGDGGSRYMLGEYTTYNNLKNREALICTNNAGNTTLTAEALSRFPECASLKDHTIEYKYKLPGSNQNRTTASLRMRASSSSTGYGVVLGSSSEKQFYNNAFTGKVLLQAGNTKIAEIEKYTVKGDLINIRMSTVGDNIQYYIDNDKVFDVNDTTVKNGGKMWLTDNTLCGQWYKPSTIDDFSITSVKTYDELPSITKTGENVNANQITVEFSKDIGEVKNHISLVQGENSCEFEASVIDNNIIITPDEGLSDGVYVLNIKKGLPGKELAFLDKDYQLAFEKSNGVFTQITITKPEISNIVSEFNEQKFNMTFDYTGNENNSTIIISASDKEDGAYSEIYNGKLTQSPFSIDAGKEFENVYLKVKILPEDIKGFINDEINTGVILGMFAPTLSDVEITDDFENGSVEITGYTLEDKNNDITSLDIQWYRSDSINGEYKAISGATSEKLEITDSLKDEFIRVYITPKSDVYPYSGNTYESKYFCRIFPPEALNVRIEGEAELNTELMGKYDFSDKNDPDNTGTTELGTTVQWLISDKADGEYLPTGNETDRYTITNADIGKYLKFEVTPKKSGVDGTASASPVFICPAQPEAKNVSISGTIKVGYTVTGTYEYTHSSKAEEGTSVYAWYVDGTFVSNKKLYTISSADAGKEIYFMVTPIAKKAPEQGEAVKSPVYNIPKASTSSGGSSSGGGGRGSSSMGVGISSVIDNVKADVNKLSENDSEILTRFTDISESVYKKEIAILTDKGIIKGVSETEFEPERGINRAEFTTLMVRLLKLNIEKYNNVFKDITADSWYANNVQTAYGYGLVEGFEGEFRPLDTITIEEIIKILIESYEKKASEIEVSEEKVHDVSDWAVDYAKKAVSIGLITDREFNLKEVSKREVAAVLVYRYMEKAGDIQ